MGYLAKSSSVGPTLTGLTKPDVCAPGVNIVSSQNYFIDDDTYLATAAWDICTLDTEYETWGGLSGYFHMMAQTGTSMSAPVVTGAIALWLQANPQLSTADVRDVLRHTSYKDSYVTSGNPERWGSGKLDINAGIRYVLNIEDKNGDVNGDGEVNVSDINVVIDIVLGGKVDNDTRRRADVNNDGEVSLSDINMIIDVILG